MIDSSCGYLSLCEAAAEASSLGKIGQVVAKASSSNIAGLLGDKYDYSETELEKSGYLGAEGKQCKKVYRCKEDIGSKINVWVRLFRGLVVTGFEEMGLMGSYVMKSLSIIEMKDF